MGNLTKTCTHCRLEKPISEFLLRKGRGDRDSWCKPCKAEYLRTYRKEHPRAAAAWRNRAILKRYGLTIEEYDKMFVGQDGRCSICGRTESEVVAERPVNNRYGRLHVDHDKSTGRVRGLLCGRCNRGIGMFLHDTKVMVRAIAYLEDNTAFPAVLKAPASGGQEPVPDPKKGGA